MSATETKPLLSVRHLSKKFPVGKDFFGRANKFVHAVNDVSFDIMPGETFSLVGESGCGKSTTSRLINHLIKPNEGEILFEGKDVAKLSEKEVRAGHGKEHHPHAQADADGVPGSVRIAQSSHEGAGYY